MMEKEPIKVNLSTVVLLILIIVLIAGGIIVGMMYNQNMKNIKTNDNNSTNASEEIKTISESEVKEALNHYLNLSGAFQGSPYSVLEVMKEITGKNVINQEYPEAIEFDGEYILPTNIKYADFKEFMLNYMTEELFNSEFGNGYVNKNGELYCKNIGATGVEYEVKSVEKTNGSDTKYKAQVNTIFDEDSKNDGTFLFEIKEINNKYVISDITYPSEIQDNGEENIINETKTSNTTKNTNQNNNKTDEKDLSQYVGVWQSDLVLDSGIPDEELVINKIDSKSINFDYLKYRIESFENITATLSNNVATFNFKNILNDSNIKGTITLSNNTVILKINDSSSESIKTGTYVFKTKTKNNNTSNENIKTNTEYKEITKKLSGIDVFFVTNVIKNNNNYTLKGVIYTEYTLTKNELDNIVSRGKILLDGKKYTLKSIKDKYMPNAIYVLSDGYTYIEKKEDSKGYYLYRSTQISDVWKKSNEFRKITISGDTIIEDQYTEDKTNVDSEFDGWKSKDEIENNTMPSPAYRFEFKNGKCSKIIRATTSI